MKVIERKSFAQYIMVGMTTAAIYFGGFVFFYHLFDSDYAAAISCAYLFSLSFNFTANRFITFSSYRRAWRLQLTKYLTIALLNYLLSLLVVHAVVVDCRLSAYIGSIVAIGATVMTGYLFSKYWIYSVATEYH